jgi:hypothetical protein
MDPTVIAASTNKVLSLAGRQQHNAIIAAIPQNATP